MQMLYTGSIASIDAVDGSATWTLTTLKLAMGQIMSQRKPNNIPTLDYLSDYSAGEWIITVAHLICRSSATTYR